MRTRNQRKRRQHTKRKHRYSTRKRRGGTSPDVPFVTEQIDKLRQELSGQMDETNIEFLASTYRMVLESQFDKRQQLMSDFIRECIGAYKQEYERKEGLSFFDYSGVNTLFKRLEQGLGFRYFSDVLNKIFKFTVVEPPEEIKPAPENDEKIHLFRCMLYRLYKRALELDRFIRTPRDVKNFTLWRGVKGGNLIEIAGLTEPGQVYTFDYLVSGAFKIEGALGFTDPTKRVICEIFFKDTIPGICISADLECEVLLGKGATVRYVGEKPYNKDGVDYTIKEFLYLGLVDEDREVVFVDTLEGINNKEVMKLYRSEEDSSSPSQRNQYFGTVIEADLEQCISKLYQDRGSRLTRHNAGPTLLNKMSPSNYGLGGPVFIRPPSGNGSGIASMPPPPSRNRPGLPLMPPASENDSQSKRPKI